MANNALIIDDDRSTLDMLTFQLRSEGYDVTTAESGNGGLDLIKQKDFDIILTDLHLPDISGIGLVKSSKEIAPQTEIIMITGDRSNEKAIEATKAGAFWYLEKPVDINVLLELVGKAVERKRQFAEIEELRGRLTSRTKYEDIIGGARSMQNIYDVIENVAPSDANILILGESGTGKEVIANAIHEKSRRKGRPFIKVNCSALPKDLIESQLFGHIKGSFTGANADKTGFIGQANGGSLLLDEIGETPIDLQPKLLRVLQEKVYYRVGSDKPQEADFRLICSTNRSPFDAIKDGNLREDLYYRINTIEIVIPPLRERMEDVPMLAEHFLDLYAEKYKKVGVKFSQSAYDQMLHYGWRGNVRELQHVIERAVLLSQGDNIEQMDIPKPTGDYAIEAATVFAVSANASSASSSAAAAPRPEFDRSAFPVQRAAAPEVNGIDLTGDELFEAIGKLIVDKLPDPVEGEDQKDVFNDIESGVVLAALKRTKGNKQAAANLLGLYRPRLYGMIKRHKLEDRV